MRKLAVLFSVLSIFLVKAQDAEIPQKMKDLAFMEGTWSIENFSNKKDKGWSSIGSSWANIILEHDGRFIKEQAKYLTDFGEINMITHIGFDSRINSYKLSAMDKEYGLMDIYFGEWVGGNLIFTNLESDKPVIMGDGQELSFRLSYMDVESHKFTHMVEGTFDKGKTWFPFSKSVYTKSKD